MGPVRFKQKVCGGGERVLWMEKVAEGEQLVRGSALGGGLAGCKGGG